MAAAFHPKFVQIRDDSFFSARHSDIVSLPNSGLTNKARKRVLMDGIEAYNIRHQEVFRMKLIESSFENDVPTDNHQTDIFHKLYIS